MISSSFMLSVLRHKAIPWIGTTIAILGCVLYYAAFYTALLSSLGLWAYVIPAIAIVIGVAMIVGHLLSSTKKIYPQKSNRKTKSGKPIKQKTFFSPKPAAKLDKQHTFSDLIDELHKKPIWGTSDFEHYMRDFFNLPVSDSRFKLINLGNFHWVTQLDGHSSTIDNPGSGDCFFYAFALGLAAEIIQTGNDAILKRWCELDPNMMSWLDGSPDSQLKLQTFRDNLNALVEHPSSNKAFWGECQRSLRRTLAQKLKNDFRDALQEGITPSNFLLDDYVKYVQNPKTCARGNFFVDIGYELSREEQRFQEKRHPFKLIKTHGRPTLGSLKDALKKDSPTLICDQTNLTYYYWDPIKKIISTLELTNNQYIQLNALFHFYTLVHLSSDPSQWSTLTEQQQSLLRKSPSSLILYNKQWYRSIKQLDGSIQVIKVIDDLIDRLRDELNGTFFNLPSDTSRPANPELDRELNLIDALTGYVFYYVKNVNQSYSLPQTAYTFVKNIVCPDNDYRQEITQHFMDQLREQSLKPRESII